MRHEIMHRIERHLDAEMGLWTRLLPWRREMAVHLEEAYQSVCSDTSKSMIDNAAWQKTLTQFGNVRQVAIALQKEHWPQYFVLRLGTLIVSAVIVFFIINPWVLIDSSAIVLTIGPLFTFLVWSTWRGSTHWAVAHRVGVWGGLCGGVLGLVGLLADLSDPANVGRCMAVSLLSVLYCTFFFTPSVRMVIALVAIAIANFVFMEISFRGIAEANGSPIVWEHYRPSNWRVDTELVARVFAFCVAGIFAGLARFGFQGVARHALALGTAIFLLSLIVMLGDMSDPSRIIGHFLLALSAMGLVTTCSYCLSNAARLVRRLAS